MKSKDEHHCELSAHLYVDDVIRHVKSALDLDLQRALTISERLASNCQMRWALAKGKVKLFSRQNLRCKTCHSRSQEATSRLLLMRATSEWNCVQMKYWNAASRTDYRCDTLH